jgi:hypothetical protein
VIPEKTSNKVEDGQVVNGLGETYLADCEMAVQDPALPEFSVLVLIPLPRTAPDAVASDCCDDAVWSDLSNDVIPGIGDIDVPGSSLKMILGPAM